MKKNNKKPEGPLFSNNWSKVVLGLLLFTSFAYMLWYNGGFGNDLHAVFGRPEQITYSDFLTALSSGSVKDLVVEQNGVVSGTLLTEIVNGTAKEVKFKTNAPNSEGFWKKLEASGVRYDISNNESTSAVSLLYWLILFIVIFITIFLISQIVSFIRSFGSGSGPSSSRGAFGVMGKSKARFYPAGTVGVKFDDVAGANEVKEELKDIVEFLKNPEKFIKIGAKIPRGVLLCGDPGNGKTLLARAVAGEASCPFFSINGSDFVEMFVGVGAARVRDLFKEARRNAPAIIFIDEIDAIGRQRSTGNGSGNDEREQTLNQMLAEMDGFDTEPGEIICIGATNRSDVLDNALTRPGRFDRKIFVPQPDVNTREKILRIHARGVKLSPAVDLKLVAKAAMGFSGADLANLINEAALMASKDGREEVTPLDLDNSRDRHIMGSKNSTMVRTPEQFQATAYHEAGHALCLMMQPTNLSLYKVTILSRGGALGVTHYIEDEESRPSTTSQEYIYWIVKCLGGMAAEELVYGAHAIGVSSDLQTANKYARAMVAYYGMSKLGPMTFNMYSSGYTQDLQHSQAYLEKIDEEVNRIITDCYKKATAILSENRDKLELLAKALLEKETLTEEEAYEAIGMTIPVKKPRLPK